MTTRRRFTLTQYLIEQRRRFPGASGDFNALLLDVALACKAIARSVAFGELSSVLGHGRAGGNHQRQRAGRRTETAGRDQQRVLHPDDGVGRSPGGHGVRGDGPPLPDPCAQQRGKYLLVFDPLDGSSNIDVNVTVGSIFSILRAPQDVIDSGRDVVEADFLQPGTQQMAAGYALVRTGDHAGAERGQRGRASRWTRTWGSSC
jgi:fructose-1,6-bisphosphatase I/sedoheptulose-1,7-bisphosphatase